LSSLARAEILDPLNALVLPREGSAVQPRIEQQIPRAAKPNCLTIDCFTAARGMTVSEVFAFLIEAQVAAAQSSAAATFLKRKRHIS